MIYLFFSACILVFLSKSVADTVALEHDWEESLFSRFNKTSYFGPKTHTAERKDKMGAWIGSHSFIPDSIANYLAHTILVGFTDIWHGANFLRRLGYYLAIFSAFCVGGLPICTSLLYTSIFVAGNMIGFWLFYNYIFQKSEI